MIIKSFEANKIKINENRFILLYGKNEGLKIEVTNTLLKSKVGIKKYEEKEILDSPDIFLETIISQSLFEAEKVIIIKRVTDKFIKIIEKIDSINNENILIILYSDNLEKRSKLRSLFEKNKRYVCMAFYPDTAQTLSKLTYEFFKKKKVSISQANINLVVNKCNGEREILINELNKIEYFCKNGKKLTHENIALLTNIIENHSVAELIDNCLVRNKNKIVNILNENNFTNEDCILITRTFLNKAKKLLKLAKEFKINNNIDLTISSAKPPIFWKDKEITKQQISKWTPENIKNLIYRLNEMELLIKKNINNSINLVTDFILDQTSSNSNS